jgi:hypothetical protein
MLRQDLRAAIANAPAVFNRQVLKKSADKLSDEEARALLQLVNMLSWYWDIAKRNMKVCDRARVRLIKD